MIALKFPSQCRRLEEMASVSLLPTPKIYSLATSFLTVHVDKCECLVFKLFQMKILENFPNFII